MKKRCVVLLIFFILLFSSIVYSELQNKNTSEIKIEVNLEKKIQEEENVRVIVTLKEEESKNILPFIKKELPEKEKIENQQEEVLKRLDNDEFELKNKFSNINAFAGELTEEGLEKLKKEKNVESIKIDSIVNIVLAESIPLIKADKANNLTYNNSYLNGSGQTICVIDTGVDSTHEALQNKIIAEHCYCSVNDLGSGGCCPDHTAEDDSAVDDYGHGTHVIGTIASINNTYRGVAPGSNIVAVKALNSTGSGYTSEIINGIDWCIDNKDTYNITIISMSLGGNRYYDYCDSDSLASAANKAANSGIFVAVASGNNGYSDSILSPACASNVTSVGSIDDGSSGTTADTLSSFTNTDEILDLLAPGKWVTSTVPRGSCSRCHSSGYNTVSGTSMAAPHVAGVAALLLQYKDLLEGTSFTPKQIEDRLKDSGKNITDPDNGLNFSRINVFSAIDSLDINEPEISFVFPTPDNNSQTRNNFVFINMTTNENLNTIFLEWNGSNESMSGTELNYYINKTDLSKGNYSYKIFANDSFGNMQETGIRHIRMNNSAPRISSFEPNASNVTINENSSIKFNISVLDDENDSLSFNWYLNGSLKNTTQNYTYEADFNAAGLYKVNVSVSDGFLSLMHNWNLTIVDIANAPILNIISNITVNESDLVDINASGEVNATDTDNDNLTFSYSSPLNSSGYWQTSYQDSGNYTVNVSVSDGNLEDFQLVNIEVLETADIDNDGINDSSDPIIGTSSYVLSESFSNITVFVNDSFNITQNFTDIQTIEFKNNITNETLVSFNINFSLYSINLTNVSINNYSNATAGSIIIKNLVLPENITKSVYVDDKNESVDYVCIKDAEIDSVSDISISCNSSNEFLIKCNSSIINGYNCSDLGAMYLVSGLNHSGIREHICQEDWSCSGWSSCSNSIQTRTCSDNNNCGTELNKHAESQSCTITPPSSGGSSGGARRTCKENWTCTDWEECIDGIEKRTCSDENKCGTKKNKPIENRTCEAIIVRDKEGLEEISEEKNETISKTEEKPGLIEELFDEDIEPKRITTKQILSNIKEKVSLLSLANSRYILALFSLVLIVIIISKIEKRL